MSVETTHAKKVRAVRHRTNVPLLTGDVLVPLIPHKQISMEQALEFCREDECVEVTPATVRMRKVVLDRNERDKVRGRAKKA